MNEPQVPNDGQPTAPSLQPVYEYLARDKGFKDIVPTYQDFVEAKDTEGMLLHISKVYDKDKTFATMLDKGVDAKTVAAERQRAEADNRIQQRESQVISRAKDIAQELSATVRPKKSGDVDYAGKATLGQLYDYFSGAGGDFQKNFPTEKDLHQITKTPEFRKTLKDAYTKDPNFKQLIDTGTYPDQRPSKRPQNEMQQMIFDVSQQQQDPNETKVSAGYNPIKIKAFGKQFEAPRMLSNLVASAAINLTRGVIGGISTFVGAAGQGMKAFRDMGNAATGQGEEGVEAGYLERKAQEVFEGGAKLANYGSEKGQQAFANSGVPLESGGVVTDPSAGAGTIAKSAAGYVAGQLTNSLPYIVPYLAGPAAGFATNVVQMSGDNTQNAYDKLKNKITQENGGIPATDEQVLESKQLNPIISVIAAVPEAAIERYFGEGFLVKNLTEAVAAKKLKQLVAEKGQAGLKEFAQKYLNKNFAKEFAVNLAKDVAGEEVQSGIEATQGSYQAGTPQTDAGGGADRKVYTETLAAAGALGVGLAAAPAIINSVKSKGPAPITEQTAASMAGAYTMPNAPKASPQKGAGVVDAINGILIDAEPSKSRSAAMKAVLEDAMEHDDVPITTQDLAGLSTTTEAGTDIVSRLRPDEEGNLTLVQDGEELRPLTKEESDEASTFATANLLIGVHAGSLTKAHARVLTDILDGAAIAQAKQSAVNDDGSPKNPLALAADNALTALKGIADKNVLDTESGKVKEGEVPQELQWQREALDNIGSMQAGDVFRAMDADMVFNGIDADGNVSITDNNGATLTLAPEQVAGLMTAQRATDADVAAQKEAVSAYGNIPASSPAYEPLRAMKDFTKSMRAAFPNLQVIADKGEMDAVINKKGIALKDGDTVYGFVHNGKVYLDPDKVTKDTPAHEILGHVHNKLMKEQMPDLYTKLTGLVGQTPLYQEVADDEFYKARIADGSMTADDIAEEALAQFIAKHYGNQQSPYVGTRWYEKLAEIIGKAWRKLFGKTKQLADLSPADIQTLTLESFGDLLNQEVKRGQSSIAQKGGKATNATDISLNLASGVVPQATNTQANENLPQTSNQEPANAGLRQSQTEASTQRAGVEQSPQNAYRREEAREALKQLSKDGVLVSSAKTGSTGKPMTEAEIDGQMALLDAMSNVWSKTTGKNNFYETFISDIKRGDIAYVKSLGGVLFQDESDPKRPTSTVSLAIFKEQQFEKMVGQNVSPQSIKDFIKGRGKQIERDIINEVLDYDKYQGQKRISFNEFKADVEIQVMKLEKIRTQSYATYGRENLGSSRDYGDAETVIFNSPINHGEKGHFSGDFDTSGLSDKEWEVRQIPGTDTYAAVDKAMPAGATQAEIQQYVGTAGTEADVKRWVERRNAALGTPINEGLFGHIRSWFNKATGVFHLAEAQSDYFQKNKASELLAASVPQDEVDEYMNREVWKPFHQKYAQEIKENTQIKSAFKDNAWEFYDKNGTIVNRKPLNRKPFIGYEEGEHEEANGLSIALSRLARTEVSVLERTRNTGMVFTVNVEPGNIERRQFEFKTREEAESFSLEYGRYISETKEYSDDLYDRYKKEKIALEIKEQEYINKRVEELKTQKPPLVLKQFVASQKVHELRLFREAIKHAAEEGATTLRFPSPYTIAVIEGYVSGGGNGAPYTIEQGDSDRLYAGDVIDYGGTRMTVVDSDRYSITVAPSDEVYNYDVYEYIYSEATKRIYQIEYEGKNHFADIENITAEDIASYEPDEWMGNVAKDLLQEAIDNAKDGETVAWRDIESELERMVRDSYSDESLEDLFFGYQAIYAYGNDYVYVVKGRGSVETLQQPDEYEAVSNADNYEENLSSEQKTVVSKYKEMGEAIVKMRPDASIVTDDNGFDWLETKITPADISNPVIAFQQEGAKIKGAVDFVSDNKATIHLFDGADVSTLAHEIGGHIGRRMLEKMAETSPKFAKDYETAKKWAGAKDGVWTTAAEEKFARGFEKYLLEGKAPNDALKNVFKMFAKWLTNIYQHIKGSSIDIELTPEIRQVFDNLLADQSSTTESAQPLTTPQKPKQEGPIFADLATFVKTLSEADAKEYARYEDIAYRLAAMQGREQGYKPYEVSKAERQEYAALEQKFDTMFANFAAEVYKEDEESAKEIDIAAKKLNGIIKNLKYPESIKEIIRKRFGLNSNGNYVSSIPFDTLVKYNEFSRTTKFIKDIFAELLREKYGEFSKQYSHELDKMYNQVNYYMQRLLDSEGDGSALVDEIPEVSKIANIEIHIQDLFNELDKSALNVASAEEKSEPKGKKESGIKEKNYQLQHRITKDETSSTLDDLTQGSSPSDIYTNIGQYANLSEKSYQESVKAVKAAKGNPDAIVTIYRSVPKGVSAINAGDWVSLSKTYATEHGYHETDQSQDMPVISMQVKAKDVVWDGNDLNEFAYFPNDIRFSATTETTAEESGESEKPSGPFKDSPAMSKAQDDKKEAETALAEAQKRGQKSLIDKAKEELAKAQLAYDTEFGKYVEAKTPELYINLTRLFEEATNRKRTKEQLERGEANKFFVKALFSKRPEISDMKKFGLLNKQLADLDALSEHAIQTRTNYVRDLVDGLTAPQIHHMVRYIILSDVVGAYDEKYRGADGLREKLLPLALSEAQAREQFATYKAWLDDSPIVKERVEWRRQYLKNLYNEAVKYGLATSFITDIKDENEQYYEWFHRSIMKYEDGEGGKAGRKYTESLNATLKHNAFRERAGSDADYDIRLGTIDGNVVAALTYAVERRKIAIEMMAPYVQKTMDVKEALENFKKTSSAFLNLTLLINHITAKIADINKIGSQNSAKQSLIRAKQVELVRDNPEHIALLKEMATLRKQSKAYQDALSQYDKALAQAPLVEKRKAVSEAKRKLTSLKKAGNKYQSEKPKSGIAVYSKEDGSRKAYTPQYVFAKIAYEEAENEYATALGNFGPANEAAVAKAKALSEIEGYQALMNKDKEVVDAIKASDEFTTLTKRAEDLKKQQTRKLENARDAYVREMQRLTDDYMRVNAPEGYTLVDAGKNPVYSLEKTDPYEIDSPFAQMGLDQIAVPVIREFTIKDGDAVYLPNEVKALFDRMNRVASEKPSKAMEQFYKGVKFIRRASAWNLLFNPTRFYNFLSQNIIENSSRAMATNLWGNNVFAMARDVGKEAIAFAKFIRTHEDPTGRYAKARKAGAINTDFGAKVIGNAPSNTEVEMLDSSRDPYLVFTFGGKVFNLPHVEPLSIKIPFKKSPIQISQGSRTDKYIGKNTVLLGVAKYLWQKAGAPLYGATVAINSSVENGYRMATIAKLEAKEGDINKPLTQYYSSNAKQINSIFDETVKRVKASDEFYKTPKAGEKPPYPVDAKTGKYLTDGGRALLRRAREQQIGAIAADIYGNYLETPYFIDQGEKMGLLMFSRYQAVNVKTTINAFRNNFIMPRQLMPDGTTNTAFPVTAGKLAAKFGWRTTGRFLHVFMWYQAAQLLTAAIRYWQTKDDDEMKKAYETLDKTNKNPFVITSFDRATRKVKSYQVPNAVGDLMRLTPVSDFIYSRYQDYLYFRGDKGETITDMMEESMKNTADAWYGIVSPTLKQINSVLINAMVQDNQDRSMSLFHSKYMPPAKQGIEGVGRAAASVLAATQEYDMFARLFKKSFDANYVPSPYEEDKARESPLVSYTTLNAADLDKKQMQMAYAVASASIGKYGKAGERTEYDDLKEKEKEISKACAYALINEDVALFSRTYPLLFEAAGTEKKADRAIQYGLSLYDPFSIYDSKDKELKHKRYAMMFGAAMGFTLGLRDAIEPYNLDEAYAEEVKIIEHNAVYAVDEAAKKKKLDAKYSVAYDLKEKDRRILAQGYLGYLNQKRQNYYSLLKNNEGQKFSDKLADSDDLYTRVSKYYKQTHPNE